MKYNIGFFAMLSILFCSCKDTSGGYITVDGKAQGTTYHMVYRDYHQRDFSGSIDSLFRVIDSSMSLWDTNSIISRINRNDTTAKTDEHFKNVFARSEEISEATGGAFDVTVGPLVKAWGFSIQNNVTLPDSATIDSLKKYTGFRKVALVNDHIEKDDPRIQIDFNAIAQGYTVDLVCSFLQRKGISDFLVEIGGELKVKGKNEHGDLWQVGIDQPTDSLAEGRPLQTIISLKDKALATSGSYRKFVIRNGQKLSHIIDPSTGYPIGQNILSVSVLADDCTTADGYATAFLVMGMEKAMVLAKEKNMEIYCIYSDAEGKLQVLASPGFPVE